MKAVAEQKTILHNDYYSDRKSVHTLVWKPSVAGQNGAPYLALTLVASYDSLFPNQNKALTGNGCDEQDEAIEGEFCREPLTAVNIDDADDGVWFSNGKQRVWIDFESLRTGEEATLRALMAEADRQYDAVYR